MQRRKFSREFEIGAVVRAWGVKPAATSAFMRRLRKWVNKFSTDLVQVFPGNGQMKPEQVEIERPLREVHKLKAEREILKPRPSSRCKR